MTENVANNALVTYDDSVWVTDGESAEMTFFAAN